MKVLAVADLHGVIDNFQATERLIDKHRPDWIVLLGDLLPDFQGSQSQRLEAQNRFWSEQRFRFLRDFATTTLVRGNHEVEPFEDGSLSAVPRLLDRQVVRLEGIPAEHGAWGWSREWDAPALHAELERELHRSPSPVLYLSHVPPLGLRDRTRQGDHIGHRVLARHLNDRGWPLALVLCGHVHEAFGIEEAGGTTVLNVANGFALLEWMPSPGDGKPCFWRIEAQARFQGPTH